MELTELVQWEPAMVTALVGALAAIFAHAMLTAAVRLRQQQFCWAKLSEFLATDAAPYGLVLVGLGVGGLFNEALLALYYLAAAAVVASHIDKMRRKLLEDFELPLDDASK